MVTDWGKVAMVWLFWVTVFILHSVNLANGSGLCRFVFPLLLSPPRSCLKKVRELFPDPSPTLTLLITILSSSGQVQSSREGQVYEKLGVSGIYTLSQQARSLGIIFH